MVVPVIVLMPVQRQRTLGAESKQRLILWGCRNECRCTLATYVSVKADHMIRRAHDNVQIVTNHQHGAIEVFANVLDKTIKRSHCRLIKALCRFIQHQQVGPDQQCLGK